MIISIILPTLNSAHTIKQTIESVLVQTYTDVELIVIDDGSTDDTDSVVKGFADPRIVYIKQKQNQGVQKTLNHGLSIAKGKYIARIDADDVWNDISKLQTQVSFLEANQDHVLVGTGVVTRDTDGIELNRYLLPETDAAIRARILSKNCFAHSSVMFVKDAANAAGGYSEDKRVLHAEDYDLWIKLGLKGKFANIPEHMTTIVVAPGTITAHNRVVQAKRILGVVWRHKKYYPNALFGIAASLARYVFFCITQIIPVPRVLISWMHRFSKSV